MQKVTIYILKDPITNEIRYVGKTTCPLNERLSKHIYDCTIKNRHTTNWVKSILRQGYRPIIEELDSTTEKNWMWLEIYWIAQLKSWGFRLTNQTTGGEIGSGRKSEITKEKLRQANLGKKQSEETKKKRSESLKAAYKSGKRDPKNYQYKITAKQLGKKRPEQLGNISAANMIRLGQYNSQGELIKEWQYVKQAAKTLGLHATNITAILKGYGKAKTCGGFKWKIIE